MSTNIGLAFFHGWGLDQGFWQPLAAELRAYPQTFWDAGYFGPSQTPDFSGATRWVAIGHSMGWVHALEHTPLAGWVGMVSLCGFTRFCAQQPGEAGQAKRVVERMVRVLERTPHAVWQDFLQRCGLSALSARHGDPSKVMDAPIQADRLRADLSRLADVDATDLLRHVSAPVLAVAAQDDAIVSADLTEATFGGRPLTKLIWHPQGGHALGYAHAPFCAQAIQAFLTELDDGQNAHQ